MVIDSNGVSNSAKLSEIIQVNDGYNVAFVYNSSSTDSDTSLCQVNFFLAKKFDNHLQFFCFFFVLIKLVDTFNDKFIFQGGMLCLMEEFSRFYVEVLNEFLTNEMETYNDVHPEEWELIKPDKREKSEAMMNQMRNIMHEKGKCGNCSKWEMKASEIKENGFVNNLDVGTWEPTQGLLLQDDIFPHVTGGLRNRRIVVTATDVRHVYQFTT